MEFRAQWNLHCSLLNRHLFLLDRQNSVAKCIKTKLKTESTGTYPTLAFCMEFWTTTHWHFSHQNTISALICVGQIDGNPSQMQIITCIFEEKKRAVFTWRLSFFYHTEFSPVAISILAQKHQKSTKNFKIITTHAKASQNIPKRPNMFKKISQKSKMFRIPESGSEGIRMHSTGSEHVRTGLNGSKYKHVWTRKKTFKTYEQTCFCWTNCKNIQKYLMRPPNSKPQ